MKNKLKTCSVCGSDLYGEKVVAAHFEKEHPTLDIITNTYPTLYWLTIIPGMLI